MRRSDCLFSEGRRASHTSHPRVAAHERLLTALLPVLNEAGFRLATADGPEVTPSTG